MRDVVLGMLMSLAIAAVYTALAVKYLGPITISWCEYRLAEQAALEAK